MPVRDLPYKSIHHLIREHLSPSEDAGTSDLIRRLRAARGRGYLTKGELEEACRWKSPRTAGRVRLNSHHSIRRATGIALAARSERERLQALLDLQGVSVPTASAILTLLNPRRYGVIDIRVWQLLHRLGVVDRNPEGTKLSVAEWECFLVLIRRLATAFAVPARDIERTLFVVHREYQHGRLYH